MAFIRERNNSYQICVSCGYDTEGKQIIRTKTWKPTHNMTKRQIEKELNRQTVLFEEACLDGYTASKIKLGDFIKRWKEEYAIPNLKPTTLDSMGKMTKRIDEEIGHMHLDKIKRRNIQMFIQSLYNGNDKHKPLGAKTIKNYVSCVSSIMNYAIRLDMLNSNPCSHANIPRIKETERDIYTPEEAQIFLDRLTEKAPLVYQCYFILMIFSGFRRGEICGLTWDDIDFENHIISINKALYHTAYKGTVIDTPKSVTSNRSLKLSEEVFEYLKRLQKFYEDESVRLGTKWQENNFVFKNPYGGVMSPLTPRDWLNSFCKREGIRYVTPHSFRHLCASIMIESGASVKTVQACMGHSDANTTLNIYAHAFSRAQALASKTVASAFKLQQAT